VFSRRRTEALETARRALQASDAAADGQVRHPLLMNAQAILARALALNDNYKDAAGVLEVAIENGSAVWGANSTQVGFFYQNLAAHNRHLGRVTAAVDAAQRAIQIAEANGVQADTFVGSSRKRALGLALLAARRANEATPLFEDLVVRPPADGVPYTTPLELRAHWALSLADAGQITRAQEMIDAVLAEARASNVIAFVPFYAAGHVARLRGDTSIAIDQLQRAVDAGRSSFASDRADALVELGLALIDAKRDAEALTTLQQAEAIYLAISSAVKPIRAEGMLGLSQLMHRRGEMEAALERARHADEFWRSYMPQNAEARKSARWLQQLRT
jgi:tetratricopeptide (TPR) repeat protein